MRNNTNQIMYENDTQLEAINSNFSVTTDSDVASYVSDFDEIGSVSGVTYSEAESISEWEGSDYDPNDILTKDQVVEEVDYARYIVELGFSFIREDDPRYVRIGIASLADLPEPSVGQLTMDDIDIREGETNQALLKAFDLPSNQESLEKYETMHLDKNASEDALREVSEMVEVVDNTNVLLKKEKVNLDRLAPFPDWDDVLSYRKMYLKITLQVFEELTDKLTIKQLDLEKNVRVLKREIRLSQEKMIEKMIVANSQIKKYVSSPIHFDYLDLFSMSIYSHLLRLAELLISVLLEKFKISMITFIFKESFITYFKLDKYLPGLATFVRIIKKISKFSLCVKFTAYITGKGYYLFYLFFLIGPQIPGGEGDKFYYLLIYIIG